MFIIQYPTLNDKLMRQNFLCIKTMTYLFRYNFENDF
jgi:hypothetical protein